ncbi:type IV conjugative transfer system lipoprotein TraV [Noviherbaspirillum sp. CPCC 100848]|uniref:Type IV conjugative transfer system lipoprotein TraV n=1 Tax=Noviherbaspirillum album TaxID=3080276 RepID=A0ABU6JB32_9BURK|nr:type IV conjugative transfer system lipoprotein TraV [Noviherbaspirillum sp. CPCC 100848]MEC4720477.1 type IV conjugative transfer system lipoprotein TraV [Noviherbaspirillum sp. CPCC 100848]
MNVRSALITAATAVVCTGCASTFNTANESSFSCPGMPQGIVCKTPVAVYQSTHEAPALTESDMPFGPSSQAHALPAQALKELAAGRQEYRGAAVASAGASAAARPVREPARVMRIWIAPWVDKNDDLNFPGFIFTEVKPRTWAFGRKEFAGAGVSVPYKALAANTSASSESRDGEPRTQGGSAVPGLPAASDIKLD